MEADELARVKRCVEHYRRIGLCPLPSRSDKKAPVLKSYAEFYEGSPVPESVYSEWFAKNIQLIAGTKSPSYIKLLVVDCDGRESFSAWDRICRHHNYEMKGTWVCTTGSGGRHIYYSLPILHPPCPSGLIWGLWNTWGDDGKGKWETHKEVRIQADNALVIAPPSIHVDTGLPYCFDDQANPNKIRVPAVAPKWLIDLPRLSAPRPHVERPKAEYAPRLYVPSEGRYSRDDVLDAVGDRKLDEAKSWGLQVKSAYPNRAGWVTCWVPGREEPCRSSPSGSFNFSDGTLQDRKDCSTISFFDLGVVLGRYRSWQDCRDDLGHRYIGFSAR